jgi:predicted transposase YbfD/YdcC
VVTFDAMHMQKATVEIIRDQKGDYVGGLKGNQTDLLQEAEPYFD